MTHKFNVGDKVYIKDEELTHSPRGGLSFVQEARGTVGKVERINSNGAHRVKSPNGTTDIMGKHLLPVSDIKVGDWVKVADEPLFVGNYSELPRLGDREKIEGKTFKVTEVFPEYESVYLAGFWSVHVKHLTVVTPEKFKAGDWVFVKDEELTFPSSGEELEKPNQDARGKWVKITKVLPDGALYSAEGCLSPRHATLNPFKVGDRVSISAKARYSGDRYELDSYSRFTAEKDPVVETSPDWQDDLVVNGIFVHKRYCTPAPTMTLFKFRDETPDVEIVDEAVDHPEHYNRGAFETIDVIDDWKLNFNVGNAVKYISRYEHKGKPKEDLRKAIWYLEREIESLN